MLKGWRTILFNAVTLIMAGVTAVDPAMFGAHSATVIMLVNAVGNIVLRFLTTTAVGKAE